MYAYICKGCVDILYLTTYYHTSCFSPAVRLYNYIYKARLALPILCRWKIYLAIPKTSTIGLLLPILPVCFLFLVFFGVSLKKKGATALLPDHFFHFFVLINNLISSSAVYI